MPIGSCADLRHRWFTTLALIAGACSAPDSDAGATGSPIVYQASTLPQQSAPVAGASDDTLALAGRAVIKVTVDATSVSKDGPRDIKLFARHGSLVALSDSYPSKPRGTSLCQAGSETWFRVIDTSARKERYARLVDSCRTDTQWGDPPVSIARGGAEITLNLLSEPAVTLTLSEDGQVSSSR